MSQPNIIKCKFGPCSVQPEHHIKKIVDDSLPNDLNIYKTINLLVQTSDNYSTLTKYKQKVYNNYSSIINYKQKKYIYLN